MRFALIPVRDAITKWYFDAHSRADGWSWFHGRSGMQNPLSSNFVLRLLHLIN
jgi:hypothetical protein